MPRFAFDSILCLALAPATAASAQSALTLAEVRAATTGRWQGTLEYRDYQSDKWIGIPFTTTIERVPDGVTLIRRSLFDDGPAKPVWITTTSLLLPDDSEASTSFRAGRTPELTVAKLTLAAARDATHWTIVEQREGTDADRRAHLRETTTRDGDTLTTLKEVDFADDAAEAWLVRNRTTLKRLGD